MADKNKKENSESEIEAIPGLIIDPKLKQDCSQSQNAPAIETIQNLEGQYKEEFPNLQRNRSEMNPLIYNSQIGKESSGETQRDELKSKGSGGRDQQYAAQEAVENNSVDHINSQQAIRQSNELQQDLKGQSGVGIGLRRTNRTKIVKNNSEFIYYGRLNQKNSGNLINQNTNEIAQKKGGKQSRTLKSSRGLNIKSEQSLNGNNNAPNNEEKCQEGKELAVSDNSSNLNGAQSQIINQNNLKEQQRQFMNNQSIENKSSSPSRPQEKHSSSLLAKQATANDLKSLDNGALNENDSQSIQNFQPNQISQAAKDDQDLLQNKILPTAAKNNGAQIEANFTQLVVPGSGSENVAWQAQIDAGHSVSDISATNIGGLVGPTSGESQQVFCFCKSKDENNMIQCDKCEEWFHFQCVGIISKEQIDEYENKPFYCKQKNCSQKERKLKQKRQQEKLAEEKRLKAEKAEKKAQKKADKAGSKSDKVEKVEKILKKGGRNGIGIANETGIQTGRRNRVGNNSENSTVDQNMKDETEKINNKTNATESKITKNQKNDNTNLKSQVKKKDSSGNYDNELAEPQPTIGPGQSSSLNVANDQQANDKKKNKRQTKQDNKDRNQKDFKDIPDKAERNDQLAATQPVKGVKVPEDAKGRTRQDKEKAAKSKKAGKSEKYDKTKSQFNKARRDTTDNNSQISGAHKTKDGSSKRQKTNFVQPGQKPFPMNFGIMGLPLGGVGLPGSLGGLPGLSNMSSLNNMPGFNANTSLLNLQAWNMQMALAQMRNNQSNQNKKGEPIKNPLLLNAFPNMMKPLNLPNLVGAKRPAGPTKGLILNKNNISGSATDKNLLKNEQKSAKNEKAKADDKENLLQSSETSEDNQASDEHNDQSEENEEMVSHDSGSVQQQSSSQSKSDQKDIEIQIEQEEQADEQEIESHQKDIEPQEIDATSDENQHSSEQQNNKHGNNQYTIAQDQNKTLVKRVYESDAYYHMVLKRNSSSTKAATPDENCGDSDDGHQASSNQEHSERQFKLKKVDLYLEKRGKPARDDHETLFKYMDIQEADERAQELNKVIENMVENGEARGGKVAPLRLEGLSSTTQEQVQEVLNAYLDPEEQDITNLELLQEHIRLEQILARLQEHNDVSQCGQRNDSKLLQSAQKIN